MIAPSSLYEADGILGTAISTVTDKLQDLDLIAERYNEKLSKALADIGKISVDAVEPPRTMPVPDTPVPGIDLGGLPELDVPPLVVPDAPVMADIDSLISDLDVGDLDVPPAPEAIPFSIPQSPTMASVPVPQKPNVDTNVEIPDAPNLVLPEMEAMEKLTIPTFEFPQLPDFDGKPPTTEGITVPDAFINWSDPQYKSEMLDTLQSQVKSMMAGGTGLPAAVEDALFSRARERDSAEAERAVQESMDVWASRDFSMPPGMLAKQVSVIREQSRLKAAELNRDILIEAAKWEIESIRFAVQQGMALEQLTMNLFENTAKRLFEVARFQAEAKINVFNAQISLFNAQNSAFETLAQVYRTKLDGAIAKLTAYKTAIEGQVALGQINQQRVDVFRAKLDAVQSNVEVYKAMMSGAQVRADVIKNQFDAYRTEIQAFAEQIGAEKVKFDAYESQVKAESAKVGMYEAQARAYASTVQAVSNKADIKVKGAQLKMEAARTKVSKFLADVDAYKARLQASLSEIQTATSAYSAKVDGWKSLASANVAEAEMQSRFADMNTRTSIAYAEMQISEYQTKMQKAVEEAKIALEAAKAVGQYTAQLAAGAMSAAHVSASISGSGSSSVSRSRSNSESLSTSHNYNY